MCYVPTLSHPTLSHRAAGLTRAAGIRPAVPTGSLPHAPTRGGADRKRARSGALAASMPKTSANILFAPEAMPPIGGSASRRFAPVHRLDRRYSVPDTFDFASPSPSPRPLRPLALDRRYSVLDTFDLSCPRTLLSPHPLFV